MGLSHENEFSIVLKIEKTVEHAKLVFVLLAAVFYFDTTSSLGRYVFGSEISYNKAPPRLPGLGC